MTRRTLLARLALTVAALLVASAAIEHLLEVRAQARLSAGETFFNFKGRRVRYRLEGADQAGPTLVFLNGFAASIEQWDLLKQRLDTPAPMLFYDRSGLGLSEGWGDREAADQLGELEAILRVPGLRLPVVLVSYSTSGMLAEAFTRSHPELVGGLVFLDTVMSEQIARLTPAELREVNIVYGRAPLKQLIKNLFGVSRIIAWLSGKSSSPAGQILLFSRQWWATSAEGRFYPSLAREGIGLPPPQIPVAVLSTRKLEASPYFQEMYRLHRQLLSRSSHPTFLDLPEAHHGELLRDPRSLAASAELIRAELAAWPDRPAPASSSKNCVVYLHGKGTVGRASSIEAGVLKISPQGNRAAPGGFEWRYFPEDGYQEVRAIVGSALRSNGCARAVIHGFSNGAAAAAKLYCRGQDFGGVAVGYLIDDPVPDRAVEQCKPAPGMKLKLYSTGALSIAKDGWSCAEQGWTCEGGSTVGIDRYARFLGAPIAPSLHRDHQPYFSAPELSEWLR